MSRKRLVLSVYLGIAIFVAVYHLSQYEFLSKDERIRREQLIADFVEAAFRETIIKPEALHRWEQSEVPIIFTKYIKGAGKRDVWPYDVSEKEEDREIMSSLEESFYASVFASLQRVVPEVEKQIERKLSFQDTDGGRRYESYPYEVTPAIWLRPALKHGLDMRLGGIPRDVIYFERNYENVKTSNIGVIVADEESAQIRYAVCNFLPVDDIKDNLDFFVGDCLARGLGLINGATADNSRRNGLLRLLYCPALKEGMTKQEALKVLQPRGILWPKNGCFE